MKETKLNIAIAQIRQRMIAVARRYVWSLDEAEDVVQDSLVQLLDRKEDISDDSLPYAITIVRSRAIDHLRTTRHTAEIDERTDGGSERSVEEQMIDEERRRRVKTLIDSLPPSQQMVMKMHHYDGLSTKEIAQLTGMAEGTVRQNISRARLRLADLFKQQGI